MLRPLGRGVGGRLSGVLARITTRSWLSMALSRGRAAPHEVHNTRFRCGFRPGEDHNFYLDVIGREHDGGAPDLRPRRGSQPLGDRAGRRRDPEQRRFLGPHEDHDQLGIGRGPSSARLAAPSAAAEDRDIDTTQVWNDLISSSAGTPTRGEDRLSEVMTRYFW